MDRVDALYRDLRPYAFAIAYRMLGSVTEAEDVVQEAFVRLSRGDPDEIDSPKAYLATVTTRLSIDALRRAGSRRESYFGPWLPEPLLTDPGAGPAEAAETGESLSMAFLVVLETLSPVERAVFLLHDVFAYEYAEIASIVGKSEANCRQLAARSRRHVAARRPRFDPSEKERTQLAERFFAAATGGDMEGLVSLLAADAAFYGDGGEKGTGVRAPIFGRQGVVRVLLGLFRRGRALGVQTRAVEVNGNPGAMVFDADGGLINVVSLEISGGVVQAVRMVVNPDKLGHLGPLSPLGRRETDTDWG